MSYETATYQGFGKCITKLSAFLGAMQQDYGDIINVRFWAAVYEEA